MYNFNLWSHIMKRTILVLSLLLGLIIVAVYAQEHFSTSLHATREGKASAYKKENGGMELITGISMNDLACKQCHAAKYADGTAVDDATYTPGCKDCHDFTKGTSVPESICLGCHNRQVYEMQMYPDSTDQGDIHRKKGLKCMQCHKIDEIHGDGTAYKSWFDKGASKTSCTECHPVDKLPSNTAHNMHGKNTDKFECTACHTRSIVSCTNCHFETLLATKKNRAQVKINNFQMLLKKEGKYTSGTYMTHTYDGKTNVIFAPFRSHVIMKEGLSCDACHNNMGNKNVAINEYNEKGTIQMTKFDSETKKMSWTKGVIPLVADWNRAYIYDFTTYKGDIMNLTSDPTKWEYIKSTTDNAHLYYCEPLTAAEMKKLGFTRDPVGVNELVENDALKLWTPYPNPADQSSYLKYNVNKYSNVRITINNLQGVEIREIVNSTMNAGEYNIKINTDDLQSGTYIIVARINQKDLIQKLIVKH